LSRQQLSCLLRIFGELRADSLRTFLHSHALTKAAEARNSRIGGSETRNIFSTWRSDWSHHAASVLYAESLSFSHPSSRGSLVLQPISMKNQGIQESMKSSLQLI
jgi:hypothetical protein